MKSLFGGTEEARSRKLDLSKIVMFAKHARSPLAVARTSVKEKDADHVPFEARGGRFSSRRTKIDGSRHQWLGVQCLIWIVKAAGVDFLSQSHDKTHVWQLHTTPYTRFDIKIDLRLVDI